MRVVFMGTPDIAATCLNKILEDGFNVVGVYTQPDRPKGRGMKMVFSPVKELALQHEIQEGIQLHGSEQHLYQIMDVLLDNALKYSTVGSMVNVKLVNNGRNCLLSVANSGEPISKEDLKNVFKRFYRADKARAMNGSYGLGLSIAESIVEAHKGKIWAESENGNNIFYVQLNTNS